MLNLKNINNNKSIILIFLILSCVKLLYVLSIDVQIRYSPFDDSLYVLRAFDYIHGNAWGPYDEYILSKLPGISLWLVVSRSLGIPYLFGINVLYCLAGLLVVHGVLKDGIRKEGVLIGYCVYLFNPVTFNIGWSLVMREALSSIFTVAIVGISLQLLNNKNKVRFLWIIIFSVLFGFVQFIREEDKLYWVYLFLLMGAIQLHHKTNKKYAFCISIILLIFSIFSTMIINSTLRSYNEAKYGLKILNDYSEGEFPKLMANLRSIDSNIDNRLVMVPNEVIQNLKILIPEFKPVLDRLPEPGFLTYSCKLHGVCNEWSNGWMPWWIKKSIVEAGFSPNLKVGQTYIKSINSKIEDLCSSGKLKCQMRGEGLIPVFELRWTRAFVYELITLLKMVIFPELKFDVSEQNHLNVSESLLSKYEYVTLSKLFSIENYNKALLNDEIFIKSSLDYLSIFYGILICIGIIASILRYFYYPGYHITSTFLVCVIFIFYCITRLFALSYVAVFMGPFETRIIYSINTCLSMLCVFVIIDCFNARKFYLKKVGFK
jgi:hypothetical protein